MKLLRLLDKKLDSKKDAQVEAKLQKISNRVRKKELTAASKQKPVRMIVDPETGKSTKVVLNIQGNLRGMHQFRNPPQSAQMKKIRAMRRFYGKQMPVLQCNSCMYANACPSFKAGYECQFLPFLNSHRIESESDLRDCMAEVLSAGMRRAHLATLMETLSGGKPSPETTEALSMLFFQLEKMQRLNSDLSAKGNLTVESDDDSIIRRLFGGFNELLEHTDEAQANPIEVDPPAMDRSLPENSQQKQLPVTSGDVAEELVRDHSREELRIEGGKPSEIIPEFSVKQLK